MGNALMNSYVNTEIKLEQVRHKINETLQNIPTKYYNIWAWLLLGAVVVVAFAVANSHCIRAGFRGYGLTWRNTPRGQWFDIGCQR